MITRSPSPAAGAERSSANFVDLTGRRFSRLQVIERAPGKFSDREVRWVAKCDCGKTRVIKGGNLRSGETTSCGCRALELFAERCHRRRPIDERFWEKVDKNGPVPAHMPELGPCWVWLAGRARDGYGVFGMGGRSHVAHRVSWFLKHGEWPKLCALHRCDNRQCVRPDHLFHGNRTDNNNDMIAKGRVRWRGLRGQENGGAKIDEETALKIIKRKNAGELHAVIANDLGLSRQQVDRIGVSRWKHLRAEIAA